MPFDRLTRRNALILGTAVAAAGTTLHSLALPAAAETPKKLDPLRPTAYRFTLGDFQITTVSDGTAEMPEPEKIFGVNQTPETVKAFAAEHLLPTDKLVNGFTPVVVNTGADLVLFDTGNAPGARPTTGLLAQRLAAAGIDPASITVVVLTHFHPDHIGGLMTDGKPTFPNARYVWNGAEYAFWSDPAQENGPRAGVVKLVQSNVTPLKDKATEIKDGSDVVSGIRAMAAPGHTPGHTAFHIESGGQRLFLGGDFSNHFVLSLEQPDWFVSFDADKEQAVATRKKILAMLASERIPFTSYHMPFPALGFVEASGGSYRFVPVTYQLAP